MVFLLDVKKPSTLLLAPSCVGIETGGAVMLFGVVKAVTKLDTSKQGGFRTYPHQKHGGDSASWWANLLYGFVAN